MVYEQTCAYGGCEVNMDEYACPYNKGYCVNHCMCPMHFTGRKPNG